MLEFDIRSDQIFAEDAAGCQEFMVGRQSIQGLFQRRANGRNLCVFFRRQIIEVLVCSFTRMQLVLDTVQTGHQHGGECQIGVSHRIGEANFNATGLFAGNKRNTQRSGTIASRVSEFDRSFKARDQTTIAVGCRVCDRVQCTSMFNNAADVVEGQIGKACIAVACEKVLAVLPD